MNTNCRVNDLISHALGDAANGRIRDGGVQRGPTAAAAAERDRGCASASAPSECFGDSPLAAERQCVIRTENERLQIISDSGRLRRFIVCRGVCLLRAPRAGGTAWARSTSFDLRCGNDRRTRASGYCGHQELFGSGGRHVPVTGSFERRRRVRALAAQAWPSMRSTSWASSTASLVSAVVRASAWRVPQSVAVALLCGWFARRHCSRRRFVWRGLIRRAV